MLFFTLTKPVLGQSLNLWKPWLLPVQNGFGKTIHFDISLQKEMTISWSCPVVVVGSCPVSPRYRCWTLIGGLIIYFASDWLPIGGNGILPSEPQEKELSSYWWAHHLLCFWLVAQWWQWDPAQWAPGIAELLLVGSSFTLVLIGCPVVAVGSCPVSPGMWASSYWWTHHLLCFSLVALWWL